MAKQSPLKETKNNKEYKVMQENTVETSNSNLTITSTLSVIILYAVGYFLASSFGEFFISSDTHGFVHIGIIIILSILLHVITKGVQLNDAGGGLAIIFFAAIIWGLIVWFYDENDIFRVIVNIFLTIVMFTSIILKVKTLIENYKAFRYTLYPLAIIFIVGTTYVLVKRDAWLNPPEGNITEFIKAFGQETKGTVGYLSVRPAYDFHLFSLEKTITVKLFGYYKSYVRKEDGERDYSPEKAVELKRCQYTTSLISSEKKSVECPWYDADHRRMTEEFESHVMKVLLINSNDDHIKDGEI